MPLEPGQMLLHYRVVEKIGEGGMGSVWKAVDTTLDRGVAIKLLPEAFAADAERLARFEREAKLLAALNHPNIAAVHSVHEAPSPEPGGQSLRFIAMELVDGDDLSDVLARGVLPRDETLAIARQVAEALQAAHESGIIHRDLKPANVQMCPDGRIKVLDFGLAKAFAADPANSDPSMSPTMTSAGSVAGLILGTAGYMSPEQARGKPADKRADIWSFGCLLFEMLGGVRAFQGETVSDTLASVLKTEPDWDAIPDDTPPAIRRLLRRCLVKDARKRLHDIADARIELDEVDAGVVELPPSAASALVARKGLAPWVAAVALLAGLAVGLLASTMIGGGQVEVDSNTFRAAINPPFGTAFLVSTSPDNGVISPDGTQIVYGTVDLDGGQRRLWFHEFATGRTREIEGTLGAQYPFWSPDSQWIGFFDLTDSTLKKASLSGGPPITICPALNGKGGTWARDDTILFAPSYGTAIFQVASTGGEPRPVTTVDTTRYNSHRHPRLLPDGEHFLYLARSNDPTQQSSVRIASIDGSLDRELMRSDTQAEFAAGRLLFVREGTLLAQPLDVTTLELQGQALPLAQGVWETSGASFAALSVSAESSLAYNSGQAEKPRALEWWDRQGAKIADVGDPAFLAGISISPDGKLAAVMVEAEQGGSLEIWVHDLERGVRSRLTTEAGDQFYATWSADSNSVIYASNHRDGTFSIYRKSVGGMEGSETVLDGEGSDLFPHAVSPDGRFLIYTFNGDDRGQDLRILPLDGNGGEARSLLQTEFNETYAKLSPDGKWMTYMSNESGRDEIYVTSFPEVDRRWPISTAGGEKPTWRADGKEITFTGSDGGVMAVGVRQSGDSLVFDRPQLLFNLPATAYGASAIPVADGERMLVIPQPEIDRSARIEIVLNWPGAL